jgi:predicted Zn-dependent peptidase
MSAQLTTLANGLRIVTDAMPHLETVALGVWVRTGTRNEAEHEHGLSHLLEHMAFKGTHRRSARMIAEQIESVGGDLNAATSHETTAYYARVLKADVPLALDILSDILRNSVFDEAELAREQHVIVQEIGAAHDDPEDLADDLFQDTAFRGQPVGRSILGTPEIVRAQRPASLKRYLGAHYRAPEMLVAAAGAIDHDRFADEVERFFGTLDPTPADEAVPARYTGGESRLVKPLSEAHILLGFEGPSFLDEGFYATRVAAAVIGGGMSSRLFQRVREERGLCYAIQAFSWAFSDTGVFGVAAATEEADLQELVTITVDELSRAVDDVDETEVARARAQLKAGLLMSLESCSVRVEQIARQTLFLGRPVPMEELVERIEQIGAPRVRETLEGLLRGTPPTLTAVGPVERLESASWIAEKLASAAHPAA